MPTPDFTVHYRFEKYKLLVHPIQNEGAYVLIKEFNQWPTLEEIMAAISSYKHSM